MVGSGDELPAPAVATARDSAAATRPAQDDWKPPTEFDQIRELNSQGGRLTTLYGLLLTAYIFTVGTGPFRPILLSVYATVLTSLSALFLIDLLVGLGSVFIGFIAALATMQPSVPAEQSQRAYLELRTAKLLSAGLSGSLAIVCLIALLAIWSTAAAVPTGNLGLDVSFYYAAVLLTVVSVVSMLGVLVRHRGVAGGLNFWRERGSRLSRR